MVGRCVDSHRSLQNGHQPFLARVESKSYCLTQRSLRCSQRQEGGRDHAHGEALAPGVRLGGVVVCTKEELVEWLDAPAPENERIQLGRAARERSGQSWGFVE